MPLRIVQSTLKCPLLFLRLALAQPVRAILGLAGNQGPNPDWGGRCERGCGWNASLWRKGLKGCWTHGPCRQITSTVRRSPEPCWIWRRPTKAPQPIAVLTAWTWADVPSGRGETCAATGCAGRLGKTPATWARFCVPPKPSAQGAFSACRNGQRLESQGGTCLGRERFPGPASLVTGAEDCLIRLHDAGVKSGRLRQAAPKGPAASIDRVQSRCSSAMKATACQKNWPRKPMEP